MTKADEAVQLNTSFAAAHNGYSYYTKASYDALVASMTYTTGLDIRYQSTVDGYATAINTAYGNLKLNVADYTAVNNAIAKIPADFENDVYTDETAAEVIAAQLAITEGLTTKDQATVDAYAADLEAAIEGLQYKSADYSQVEAEKALIPADLTPYTKSSVDNLNTALNAVNYGLDINHQAEVDAFAAAIKQAREALEIDLADYTVVRTAISAANEAIQDTNYTDGSIQAVRDAINAVVYDLPAAQQATVNGYADAINTAVSKLTDKPLDLTSYNAAVARVPESLDNYYTDASVKLYTDARAAADNFKLTKNSIRNQTEFETLVSALDAAITGLKYKSADYTAVNEAKTAADAKAESGNYTDESVADYNALIATIDWSLTIDKQATVDGYADAINAFVFAYKPADYTSVNEAKAAADAKAESGNYTDSSVAEYNALIATIDWNLTIDKQTTVDAYANAINTFQFTYKPADYTELDALVEEVNALDETLYSNYDEIYGDYIFDYVMSYIPSHRDYNITEQDKVDEMKATLQSYVDMLVLKDTKVARFELTNGASYKTSGGVTYIVGLRTGLTDATLKSSYFDMENVTVTITRAMGRFVGTGTTVKVTSTLDGSVVGEYVVLIYGDISGDGSITMVDTTALANSLNKSTTLTAAQKLAANVNGDRSVNLVDHTLLSNVIQKTATINQTTGKVV